MADDFQRVEPTPFDSAQSPTRSHSTPTEARPRWLWPALGLLLLLALLVIFLLPKLVDTPAETASARPGTVSDLGAPGGANRALQDDSDGRETAAASPFADALEAKARAAAQDLLGELLALQEELQDRGAESWAPEAMENIAGIAKQGDERYRERAFEEALGFYRSALDAALALEASLPVRAAAKREATVAAIEALDLENARAEYAQAEQLAPGAEELLSLTDRLEVLPDVVERATRAAEAENAGDLSAATEAMEAAAALDQDHEAVAAEARRLRTALTSERFNRAMSDGYSALEAARFDEASARFERAASLRPGAEEAAAALREVAVARTAAQLKQLKRRGEDAVNAENWSEAVNAFEEALAIDASLRFAREGLALAKPRGRLQGELQAILDDSGRLVDDAILAEARKTLTAARAVNDPGPKLAAATSAVAETLAVASEPVAVTLRSDGETAVTVYKVARLGQFQERALSLRPGTYTAVGARRGFRDERVEFTVTPRGLAEPVFIACTETI
jgi:tetratricopeptide (TPR) repeat protein